MVESDIGKGLSMRVKHYDTFCPIGPHIETSIGNPNDLIIECWVNGKISASGNTSEMIFPVEKLDCNGYFHYMKCKTFILIGIKVPHKCTP